MVAIDAVTRGDAHELEAALLGLGLEHPAVYSNDVGGWLPVSQLEAAAALGELAGCAPRCRARASAGPVSTQGDYVQGSAALRTTYPTLTGTGRHRRRPVGQLRLLFGAMHATAAGCRSRDTRATRPTDSRPTMPRTCPRERCPAGVDVLAEPSCLDYGAPRAAAVQRRGPCHAADRACRRAGRESRFSTRPTSARRTSPTASSRSRPPARRSSRTTSPISTSRISRTASSPQAIDAVEAQGVAYFTAAGNNSDLSYENTAPSFATLSTSAPQAERVSAQFRCLRTRRPPTSCR